MSAAEQFERVRTITQTYLLSLTIDYCSKTAPTGRRRPTKQTVRLTDLRAEMRPGMAGIHASGTAVGIVGRRAVERGARRRKCSARPTSLERRTSGRASTATRRSCSSSSWPCLLSARRPSCSTRWSATPTLSLSLGLPENRKTPQDAARRRRPDEKC